MEQLFAYMLQWNQKHILLVSYEFSYKVLSWTISFLKTWQKYKKNDQNVIENIHEKHGIITRSANRKTKLSTENLGVLKYYASSDNCF